MATGHTHRRSIIAPLRAWSARVLADPATAAFLDAPIPRATCALVLLLEAIGGLERVDSRARQAWVDQLLAWLRTSNGTFAASEQSDENAFVEACVLHALDALEGPPPPVPAAIEALLRDGSPDTWDQFVSRLWDRPGALERDLAWLVFCAETLTDHRAAEAVHVILDRLLEGEPPAQAVPDRAPEGILNAAEVAHAVFAFAHHVHRPVLRLGRRTDDLMGFFAGGGMERIDLAPRPQLACACLLTLGARVVNADRFKSILVATARDLEAALPSNSEEAVSGESPVFGGEPWDVWLRAAALVRIAETYPDEVDLRTDGWRHRHWPGPGSAPPRHVLSDRERRLLPTWRRPFRNSPPKGKPVVSVVVPCHNLGEYLYDAVDSVLGQSMRAFELTIVDDGSDDEFTHEVLKWYADVARVVEQPRGGVGRARNTGIQVSRARYVCCLDADDRLAPDFLQRTVDTLERDATLGFVSTGIRLFDEEEGTISGASTALPDVLAVNQFIVSSVFRREAWAAAGGYCETFSHPGIEDWDLWIGIIERGYQAAVLSDPLFEYRVRPGSMSGSMAVPDVWGRLVRELTERHLASYQAHLPALVGRLAARVAEMRAWALDRERARAWSEQKRESWSSIALERERTISELKDWIAELETAKKWLEEQWQQSRALADARLMEIDTLRSKGQAE